MKYKYTVQGTADKTPNKAEIEAQTKEEALKKLEQLYGTINVEIKLLNK